MGTKADSLFGISTIRNLLAEGVNILYSVFLTDMTWPVMELAIR